MSSNEPWLDGIEGEYLPRLISSNASLIRCVAGPGSGKTTGLKKRVQRLIHNDGVSPTRIFVGTFTRAITRELSEELGEAVTAGITVSTLHSLGLRLLHQNPHVLGDRRMRFLLGFEKAAMLYDVGESLPHPGTQRDRDTSLKRLLSAKSERSELPDAAFAGAVERWLRRHGGMVIEEVVWMTVQALENGDIAPGWFDHVIVDEYQDLTACEHQLVELLWSRQGSLTVLGDDDQSIYGFRYNHPSGITGFANHRGEVEDIPLPENRRCGRRIVGLANLMMAEAGSRKEPMEPTNPDPGEATLLHWMTVDDEIAGLARYILSRSDVEFLVLVPRRFIGYRLADLIGADAATAFHEEVLEHPLSQERFTLASLIGDPDDSVALRAWFGFADGARQAPGRNSPAYASLEAPEKGVKMARAIAEGWVRGSGKGIGNIQRRSRLLVELLAEAPGDLKEQILFVFDPGLADKLDEEAEKRLRAARDLTTLRNAALQSINSGTCTNLGQVVDRLRYGIAVRLPLVEREEPARVKIMTLHSAKGLEADVVVAAGIPDQMIPGLATGDEREEQRRLLYVTLTRARKELILSWPRAISWADGKANYVRLDKGAVYTAHNGDVRARLAKSTLLPTAGPVARPGEEWLEEQLRD